jgi:pimeloyl-ACP methyl ester carboxylesterase
MAGLAPYPAIQEIAKCISSVGGYPMSDSISIFKSSALEKEYFEAYAAVLALWPVSFESLDLSSRFGTTHLNACGQNHQPPMILLPGYGANSTMWYPNIAALSGQFRVYAVDTIGQPGKSLPNQKLTAANSADWIIEVLKGLGIERAHLVGISLGAWLALNFAIRRPERVDHLALLDPAASFQKMSRTFFWHSLMPIMIHPTRAGLIKYFRWMTRGYKVNERWGELMVLGILNTRPQPPMRAAMFSDEDLRKLKTPTLLLIGERSVIYDPQRAYERATRLIPGIQAEIVPGASHALIAEKSELVNARILQFCQPQGF